MTDETTFSWIEPYEAIATKLLKKREQEAYLLNLAKGLCDMGEADRMDPLTFMAMFNRRQKDETRTAIASAVLKDFGIDVDPPSDYEGIPVANNQKWRYMDGVSEHIDEKWDFFESAMALADDGGPSDGFGALFDAVLSQKNIGVAKITMALYWCRPAKFLPLDAYTIALLGDAYGISVPKNLSGSDYLGLLNQVREVSGEPFNVISAKAYEYDGWSPLREVFDPGLGAEEWQELVMDNEVFTPIAMELLSKMIDLGGEATCKELSEAYGDTFNHYSAVGSALGERVAKSRGIVPYKRSDGSNQYWSIPFLGKNAEKEQSGGFVWRIRPELRSALSGCAKLPDPSVASGDDRKANHWVIAPGEAGWAWDDFRTNGIAAIGWDYLGDLTQYSSKAEIAKAINDFEDGDSSRKNDAAACFLFSTCLKPGDVIYAKVGLSKVVGRGKVTAPYRFDDSREKYKHIVMVDWTDVGEWQVEGFQLPRKTLTGWYSKHKELDALIDGGPIKESTEDKPAGWLLSANPKIWRFSDIAAGDEQSYTLYNDKGNPRRILKNFLEARPGDIVIGYESTPVKAVVAICEISRENDGERLYFKKIRDLANPVPFGLLKETEATAEMEFMRNYNGSLFRLTESELACIEELAYEDETSPLVSAPDEYTDEDFLAEVFMEREDFEDLKKLVEVKKNVILQGSPGTGKTFAAERLAWALMGCKDSNRIEKVQFHQNTSYEEFVIGFRPNAEGGFEIKEGPFVRFCERAAADKEGLEYYFIIDEINRANVSKVFGELLMLIEADHRGDKLRLSVDDRRFSVPKNVTIIGMMNTADRGLALIDYALRRRFAFFEMKPALDNKQFAKLVEKCPDKRLPDLVEAVRKLNKKISADPSLDEGFCIGHSYFCRTDEGCVDAIVDYELVPLIKEYWFDDKKKASDEIKAIKAAIE